MELDFTGVHDGVPRAETSVGCGGTEGSDTARKKGAAAARSSSVDVVASS
jgi:hypothetical protein